MQKTIHAVYERGSFRPTEPVDLPDPCQVELEIRFVNRGKQVLVSWDDIFATKLMIGSAPPEQNAAVVEMTGDDFLF